MSHEVALKSKGPYTGEPFSGCAAMTKGVMISQSFQVLLFIVHELTGVLISSPNDGVEM